MGDLADFLAARIYDDEQLARELPAPPGLEARQWEARPWGVDVAPDGGGYIIAGGPASDDLGEFRDLRHALFVSQWDPARVLLECEAKRGILLDYMTRLRRWQKVFDRTDPARMAEIEKPSPLPLYYLALPYRAHPEYSEAWAPPTPGTVETWGRR
jgi:hypothetical protein